MAYAAITQTTGGIATWPVGTVRYYEYDDSLTPAQAEAYFTGLSLPEQLTLTGPNQPQPTAGKKWQARAGSAADTAWQIDTDDGSDGYEAPSSGGGTSTPSGGGETNVINYTSTTNDDGGPI